MKPSPDGPAFFIFFPDFSLRGYAMQLYIAGGCGDQGRNCFYVEGDRHAFILDAGSSTDGLDRLPDLSPEQIRSAEYLFISHSHKDHTGAIEYLIKHGFAGPVLMSNQTYRQLSYKPENTMILDSTAPELELEPGFSLHWGRTGHCAGAVWFQITMEGRTVFYSGDYRENDTFYRCDRVRNMEADMAIIDAAYSLKERGADLRRRVAEKAGELLSSGGSLLMPVPHYGRGLSMGYYFYQLFKNEHPIYMDEKIYDNWIRLGHRKYFVHEEITEQPYAIFQEWDKKTIERGNIYFLADAQLARASSRKLIESHEDMAVLLTGSIHGYGRAKEFFSSGRATFALWPNHLSWQEMEDLQLRNKFGRVQPFHNRDVKPESDTIVF